VLSTDMGYIPIQQRVH